MTCTICYRKSKNEYCCLHETAYRNIVQAYENWKSSKNIIWKDYLRNIRDNPNSGLWVTEVCSYLLSKEKT